MLLKRTKSWLQAPEKAGILYFIQRLDELTYPYTLDSYRAPTTNVPFLIRECIKTLSDHDEHDVNPAHIDRIMDELEVRMSGNIVAHSLLMVPWKEYIKVDRKNLPALRSVLSVLAAELQPIKYLKRCFVIAEEASPKDFQKYDLIAQEISTTAINCGIDSRWISNLLEQTFFSESSQDDESALDVFFKSIVPKRNEYSAFLTLRTDAIKIKKSIREIFDIDFSYRAPNEISEIDEDLDVGQGEVYVTISKIVAPDPMTALAFAKRNISRMHDLYGLFYHKGSYEVGRNALVKETDESGRCFKLRADINRMEFIRDNRRGFADRKLEGMINKCILPRGKDAQKFFRVVDFHGMSLGSSDPENQLINLWTSLETIAPSRKGKSIIGSVISGVMPFIGLKYFDNIFSTLAKDLKRWNDNAVKSSLASLSLPANLTLSEKVFCLVVLKDYEGECSKLLGQMDDFPLLRSRIFTLSGKAKTGEKLGSWLDAHQIKVEQQIYRIYRSRNSIVHSASDAASIEHLIVSAHDYFDQVFALSSELCSQPFGFNNYADCFSFADFAYQNYKANLSSIEGVMQSNLRSVFWKPTKVE